MWIPDPELVWKGASLLQDYTGQKQLTVRYEEGEVGRVKTLGNTGSVTCPSGLTCSTQLILYLAYSPCSLRVERVIVFARY